MPETEFVDYYELMQISIGADSDTIHRVYKILATRCHPDNKETGDVEKFLLLKNAYKILADPVARAEYDNFYKVRKEGPLPVFMSKEFVEGIDGEANRRMGVLCLLYTRRRTEPGAPGLSMLDLELMMSCPREHLVFTTWYLRTKKYLTQDDRSSYTITADGIDFLEANLGSNRTMYKLLKSAEMGAVRGGKGPVAADGKG